MWLFLAFLAVPIIEIALFIQVGGLIGLWPTLAIVVLTAVAGTILVRAQGAQALDQLRGSFRELRDPTEPLAHGAMILLAGALLLTPGFFTDTLGLLLLVPKVRLAVMRRIARNITVARFEMGGGPGPAPRRDPHRPEVIDGEFTEITPPSSDRPSGWTRH